MDGLIVHEEPAQKLPTMIVAFAGWPDAAEAATGAIRHLVDKLPANKFAEIDPEEFYDFTVVRPETRVNDEGERVVQWPANDFYAYSPEQESHGLLLYVGTEPNLRWRAFSGILIEVARRSGVELVVSLGALLDAVPHTRETRVTGRASSGELAQKVEWLGIRNSGYQGPTGIHTAFLDACTENGLAHASLWGHSPHYITTSPNPKVTHALLTKLRTLVELDVDPEELRAAGESFEKEATGALAKQADMAAYVRQLEGRFDSEEQPTGEIPSSAAMVEELEHYLKSQLPGPDQPEGP